MSLGSGGPGDRLPLELSVLGTFQAKIGDEWFQAPTRQVARVATVLCGWPGEPVERDRIMQAVWGDKPPATATNTLQVHVSHLRRLVGKDTVRSNGANYILDIAPEAIDAEQFADGVAEAARMRRHEHFGRAGEILGSSLQLWRGNPFPDVNDADLEARAERLHELHVQAREDYLECRLELAYDRFALADVIADAKELVSRHPLRERGHALLVRALSAAERPSEASEAFEAAASKLRSATGLDPGRDLVTIHSQALNQDAGIYPKAMGQVWNLPPERAATQEARAVAEQVRSLVVDMGARVVSVVEPDADARKQLTLAIGRSLGADLLGGIIILNNSKDPGYEAAAEIKRLLLIEDAHEFDLATWAQRCNAAIVCSNADAAGMAAMQTQFDAWAFAPVIINVAPQPIDVPTEVVISSKVMSEPLPVA